MKPAEVMKAMDTATDAPLLRMEWILRFLAEQVPHAETSLGDALSDQARFVQWLRELAEAAEQFPTGKRKKSA